MYKKNYIVLEQKVYICNLLHFLIKRKDDGSEFWFDEFFIELSEKLANGEKLEPFITKWNINDTILNQSIYVLLKERLLIE